ncbi:MAG: cyclic nucleotide-binding domain-containing protein [Polyangia bacterium]
MREIEFEFDESGAGEFKPAGNVIGAITAHLQKSEVDRAASLLAASGPEVGDDLIAEAESGASRELWRRLAALFGEARDVGRAARCAEAIEDHELAAGYLEAAYEWERAADAYARAGNLRKAAEMYERGLIFDKAAAAYMKCGDHLRAAECFARAGAYYHAGQLYMRLGRYEQAVEVLQRVERMQRWYVESTELLGRFFERTGNARMAMQRYAELVRSRPLDESTLEVHHRLAILLSQGGHSDKAHQLWSGVIGLDPEHEGARAGIKMLTAGGSAPPASPRPEATDPPPARPQPQGSAAAPAARPAQTAEVAPLVLPGEEERPAAAGSQGGVVAVRGDFDVLRGLPIFGELSLDELREMHTLADRRTFAPGEVLIGQDRPGENLFVLVSGLVVVEIAGEGASVEVARLGTGASIGEMAMVDSAPASARVTAIEETVAFAFPIERLASHLAADPRVGFKVMKVLGRILSSRLREANRKLST